MIEAWGFEAMACDYVMWGVGAVVEFCTVLVTRATTMKRFM